MSGRHTPAKQAGRKRTLWIAAAVLAAAALLLLLWKLFLPSAPADGGTPAGEALALPYAPEDGGLAVESIFQYTGENPETGTMCEDLAAVSVTNRGTRHLDAAELAVTLTSGATLHFAVSDLPAGETAWLFSQEDASCEANPACTAITCTRVSYSDEPPLPADAIGISVEGTAVTVTNRSAAALPALRLFCHCRFDGAFFGGLTYPYETEPLEPGASTTVDAADCYLGEAAVVRAEAA